MNPNHPNLTLVQALWELDRMASCAVLTPEARTATESAAYLIRIVNQTLGAGEYDRNQKPVIELIQAAGNALRERQGNAVAAANVAVAEAVQDMANLEEQ
jgi:hypothetical protein